ncbi:YiiX/YebB-like N1pC/P60 family cysteine hydrolase [Beggiatoa leptomitoformis]|uniref:Uncharacterized protein n=1 Tax=Beggiatoa leptomitoformis TaxID=288004 RepID=A0A2N9YH75_9GAMM|nr:YiiX/YebB-like N1pC/P60 family cysteine hydrolase [Beggiatoa leptomitoformis]ALG67860.1 hypothetical protein AL038_09250 [Beggiatoa leptomitoformis]AUI69882.1 hypothetical protein BLE401_15060 [Beggiatoa leptomitoformis]
MQVERKKSFVEKLLTFLSRLKGYKSPLFIVYQPHSFLIKGKDTQEVMHLIKPGDILLRTYNNYLDKYFVKGTFTHAGLYLGEVTENHLRQIAKVDKPERYATGTQMVIHALADTVILEDLIQFCRCDALAILRFPQQLVLQKGRIPPDTVLNYLTEYAKVEAKSHQAAVLKAEIDIMTRLAQGDSLHFDTLFKIIYRVALSELITPHPADFGFDNFSPLSCTELIYFATKSICWNYDIEPTKQKIFFQQRRVIEADTFTNTDLEEVWKKVG